VLSLFDVDATDLDVRGFTIPVGDFGTVEFVGEVLDTTDVREDLETGEETANDFGVDLTRRGDVDEDLTPVTLGDLVICKETDA